MKNREIASMTKVMTAFLVIQIARRIKLDLKKTQFKVSKTSAWIGGTTAKLRTGDVLSVWDLLHGLMLPSGNDAAVCLSENFGEYLYEVSLIRIKATNAANAANGNNNDTTTANTNDDKRRPPKDPARYFILEMNRYARALKLDNTVYANPHGLSNINNKSTAVDQGRLGAIVMQDSYMREIVNKQEYECEGLDGKGRVKPFKWKNSNKLLKKGFNGIKTGITPAAGPCMATSFCKENIHLIVIVLDCKNVQNRCDDSVKLTFWGYNRLKAILDHFKKNTSTHSNLKTDDTTASSGQSSNSQK